MKEKLIPIAPTQEDIRQPVDRVQLDQLVRQAAYGPKEKEALRMFEQALEAAIEIRDSRNLDGHQVYSSTESGMIMMEDYTPPISIKKTDVAVRRDALVSLAMESEETLRRLHTMNIISEVEFLYAFQRAQAKRSSVS